MQVIRDELIEIRDNFANGRLTEIIENKGDDWVEKKLGEVCEIQLGKTPYRKTQSFFAGRGFLAFWFGFVVHPVF
jgi:DNA gyrase subunit A